MKRILAVQMHRMGDAVIAASLFKRLKDELPDCTITFLCLKESVTVIGEIPWIDRFVRVSSQSIALAAHQSYRAHAVIQYLVDLPELSGEFDTVLNLGHDPISAAFCGKVHARVRSGIIQYDQAQKMICGKWGKYLFSIFGDRTGNLFNLIDIYAGMAGIPHMPVVDQIPVGKVDREQAKKLLQAHGHRTQARLVALQLGSRELRRIWPLERFVALADRLLGAIEIDVVLLGGPDEQALSAPFKRRSGRPVIDLVAKTSAADLGPLLAACDLLISNNTGTVHVAAAVGTQVCMLCFGNGYFAETGPYGKDHVVIQDERPCAPCFSTTTCEAMPCRDAITVEAVYSIVVKMLSGTLNEYNDFPAVSVFKSRFLTNGTLIYTPLSASMSDQYLAAFVNRLVWENVCGLDHDPTVLEALRPALKNPETYQTLFGALARVAESLLIDYQKPCSSAPDGVCQPYGICSSENVNGQLNHNLSNASNVSLLQCYLACTLPDVDSEMHPDPSHRRAQLRELARAVEKTMATLQKTGEHSVESFPAEHEILRSKLQSIL